MTAPTRFFRSKRVWLTALVVGVVAAIFAHFTQANLISQSTRVPGLVFNDDVRPQAAWLDDSHLFELVKGPSGDMQAVKVDVHTGSRVALATIKGFVNSRRSQVQDIVLSPDRTHLIVPWVGGEGQGWDLATMSGMLPHGFTDGRSPERRFGCLNPWTPDSRTLVSLFESEYADGSNHEYSAMCWPVGKPLEVTGDEIFTIKVPKLPSIAGPTYPDSVLGFGQGRTAICTTWRPGQLADVVMASFPIKKEAAAHIWTIKIPVDSRVDEMVLSPRGDRLLWKLRITQISFLARTLARLFNTKPTPALTDEIWVSRLDGTGFEKIGSVAVEQNPLRGGTGSPFEEPVNQIHWSPNGKMASFVHHRYCYTVAVPGN